MTAHQQSLDLPARPTRRESRFDGETFEQKRDGKRLGKQLAAVFHVVRDGRWRTLSEIAEAAGCPEASASARLRDLRKRRFGGHEVDRRRRGDGGTWEYRVRWGAR